jgi:MFS family permease
MAITAINQTILTITISWIFQGVHADPLAPGGTSLLIWLTLNYNAGATAGLVTFGRLADIYGRVRMHALGLFIFTLGSLSSRRSCRQRAATG